MLGLLALLFVVYSTGFTILAPGGRWLNHVGPVPVWLDNDPGGWYIPSAHELFTSPGSMVFAGHPGLPMQITLSWLQYVLFMLGGGYQSGLSFTEWTARQLETVWVASKLLSTAAHLASFLCLYAFARALPVSERAARIATILYATAFPVLYYASRVSVEPWMVLFFCLTFLALWQYRDAWAAGRKARALAFCVLAGVAAVSAALSKVHLLGPLPLFCLGPLVFDSAPKEDSAGSLSLADRLRATAAFSGTVMAVGLVYSTVMDWESFFGMWGSVVDSSARLWAVVLGNFAPEEYVPGVATAGVFARAGATAPVRTLCELPFLALSGFGIALLARNRTAFRRYRWPLVYALGTVIIFIFRSFGSYWTGFHYLFVAFAVAAVGCGFLADRVLSHLSPSVSARKEWVALVVAALAVHGVAIWAAVDSRGRDVAEYRRLGIGALYDALESLGPDERVLVVGRRPMRNLHGLAEYRRWGRRSALIEEVENRLVRRRSLPPSEWTIEGLKRNGVTIILNARGPRAILQPVTAWQPPTRRP